MAKLTKRELKEQRRLESQKNLESKKRTEMLKKLGIWIGAIVILGASVWGLFLLSDSTTSSSDDSSSKAAPISSSDIIIGSESAKISLIEYADFQCPSCAAYYPLVTQLLNEYAGDVKLAYRFFPLRQIHRNAMVSAQAAYAAHLQRKFVEMYDMLFTNQNTWSNENDPQEIFIEYATQIGLDIDQFKIDMNSEETRKFVENQLSEGTKIGVNSTPTFFLNQSKIQNPRTYEDFKKLIQDEINKR